MSEPFVEIAKLMFQAPIFSTAMSMLLIYLLIDKWKSVFKIRDFRNEKIIAEQIEKSEEKIKKYVHEQLEILRKDWHGRN